MRDIPHCRRQEHLVEAGEQRMEPTRSTARYYPAALARGSAHGVRRTRSAAEPKLLKRLLDGGVGLQTAEVPGSAGTWQLPRSTPIMHG
jgi:hypothetical protein